MDLQLQGQRAFVSGSTQGIGYAVARALLREGAEVVVHGRDGERVEDAVRRLSAEVSAGVVTGLAADVLEPDDVRHLVTALGEVDVLVNNVGVFGVEQFQDATDETWHRYLEVNLMSGVRLSRHALSGMLTRRRGRIIFVSSESGVDVPADMVPYGVTKAAVLALSNGLAKLTHGTAITINTILGGPTWSDGVERAVEGIAAQQGMTVDDLKAALVAARPTSLLQRFIEPDEIAHLAVYLASPLSGAINGAALRADGGVLTTLT